MADQQAPVVELVGVSRRFGSDPPIDALLEVNMSVAHGEWLAVIGPSGSGKSTLLNVIGCLDHQTEGSYSFDGIDVEDLDDRHRSGLRSRGIGFVFQSFHLLAHRTVIDNVMLAEVYSKVPSADRRERAAKVLAEVGLANRAEFFPTHLSGGERQRAAIARALMGTPRLLLCDEPTGNLDSASTANIMDLFGTLNDAGQTVIMITHDRDVAAGRR